jgi:hypothetical protein
MNLKFIKFDWKHIEKILRIIEVVAILVGVIFATIQIRDLRNNESAQLMLEFNKSLSEEINSNLITAIENNDPILKINGGQFTTTDIDHYLTIYELLNNVSEVGLINDEMLYNAFAYDIIKTFQNKEIKDYLFNIRKENKNFFIGFETLAIKLLKVE